jgi:hypothetical protein
MSNREIDSEEMTLRDYFAAKAMATILWEAKAPKSIKLITNLAYAIADAMMEARKPTK